jgi:hypothetical protein
MYILNRAVFVECTVHYQLTMPAVAFSPCDLLGMALGPVTRKFEGWKPPWCPSILTGFANDDGTSVTDHHMSNDDMVITCQMLATPLHVMNVRYFSLL